MNFYFSNNKIKLRVNTIMNGHTYKGVTIHIGGNPYANLTQFEFFTHHIES